MAFNVKTNLYQCPIEVDTGDGSAADIYTWILAHPMLIHKVEFVVSELVASDTTDAVVSVDYTPVGGSRTEYATVSVPDTTAVGTSLEPATSLDPLELSEGDTVILEFKTASVDAGADSGKGYFLIWYESVPDLEVA